MMKSNKVTVAVYKHYTSDKVVYGVLCAALLVIIVLWLKMSASVWTAPTTDAQLHEYFLPSVQAGTWSRPTSNVSLNAVSNLTPEVDDFILTFSERQGSADSKYKTNKSEPYTVFLRRLLSQRKNGSSLEGITNSSGTTFWEKFYRGISQYALYDHAMDEVVDGLLKDFISGKIVKAEGIKNRSDTDTALFLVYDNGGQGFATPMRSMRTEETSLDRLWFTEIERHNAEIAAFHLDRILGFNRALPSVGRHFSIARDILHVRKNLFDFVSPAGNRCFVTFTPNGRTYFSVCGNLDVIEAAVTITIPEKATEKHEHPWRRFPNLTKTDWEVDESYCQKRVKTNPLYRQGSRLLDLIDMAIFDYLTGNKDRGQYHTFRQFGNDTFVLHINNTRGFSNSQYDCQSCLAPLSQCCMIRQSTLTKLIKFYQGPENLSSLMRASLHSDPLVPILWEPHLQALDRRVSKIIKAVSDCIKMGNSLQDVVIEDGIV